jgi:hypothetical protein
MKQYLVTFAKDSPQEVTYPVEAESKKEARREFSRQYIGRVDSTLCDLLKVMRDEEVDQENE